MRTSLVPANTPYEAHVTFDVDAGPRAVFGPVTVVGSQKLSEGVIRRMLPFQEGQEYSRARRLEAQRNLYSIEMIQHASIDETVDPGGVASRYGRAPSGQGDRGQRTPGADGSGVEHLGLREHRGPVDEPEFLWRGAPSSGSGTSVQPHDRRAPRRDLWAVGRRRLRGPQLGWCRSTSANRGSSASASPLARACSSSARASRTCSSARPWVSTCRCLVP